MQLRKSVKNTKNKEAEKKNNIFRLPGEIIPLTPTVTSEWDVVIPAPLVTSKVFTNRAANKIKQKCKNIGRNKTLNLLKLRGIEKVLNKTTNKNNNVFTKSAQITAKKISDKYKNMRNKKSIEIPDEVQEVASKKGAQIAAKRISSKYKKIRYKKPPLPFNFRDIADEQTVVYTDDRNMEDVSSNRGAIIAANKIKNKYKKIRAKNNSLSFSLDEIEQAQTENYVDDVDIPDVNLNRNAAIAAKKISNKYKKLTRKRKRYAEIEPIEGPVKKPKKSVGTKKSALMATKKISDKYKNLCYR